MANMDKFFSDAFNDYVNQKLKMELNEYQQRLELEQMKAKQQGAELDLAAIRRYGQGKGVMEQLASPYERFRDLGVKVGTPTGVVDDPWWTAGTQTDIHAGNPSGGSVAGYEPQEEAEAQAIKIKMAHEKRGYDFWAVPEPGNGPSVDETDITGPEMTGYDLSGFPMSYKPVKTIEVEEYDRLVANQKPTDWNENEVVIDIELLAHALTRRELGDSVLEGSEAYTDKWDEMYDIIFKTKA